MSRTITIPDSLYTRLEAAAQKHGLKSIRQLLERWSVSTADASSLPEEELRRRQEVVDQAIALQERLSRKYGMMPDSADLIREDRER